jgi:hypothetical protein
MSHIVELVAALFCLPAMLAVFLDRDTQIVFRPVNVPLTSGFRACGEGRTDQADQRQQGYAKNPDGTSHIAFSF